MQGETIQTSKPAFILTTGDFIESFRCPRTQELFEALFLLLEVKEVRIYQKYDLKPTWVFPLGAKEVVLDWFDPLADELGYSEVSFFVSSGELNCMMAPDFNLECIMNPHVWLPRFSVCACRDRKGYLGCEADYV